MSKTLASGATARQRLSEQDTHLPRSAYVWLALIAAGLGLACSATTAQFFILGLQRVESDGMAREILILAGVLMVVVELAAFGLSALLPRERLKALRTRLIVMGMVLVAFEIATIYTVQVTLVRGSDAVHQSASSRITHLEASIAQNRKASEALVVNGTRSSDSPYPASRADGVTALREAARIEQRTAALVDELTRLQAAQAPTLVTVLGEQGMVWYAVARSVLVTGMGLVMFAAAGALLRASRSVKVEPVEALVSASDTQEPACAVSRNAPSTPVMPAARRWQTAGVVPVAATAGAAFASPMPLPVMPAMPTASYTTSASRAPVAAELVPQSVPVEPVPVATSEPVNPVKDASDNRYERLRAAVIAGQLKPSVRALKGAQGGGTDTVSAYLQQMLREGLLERQGQSYVLKDGQAATRQLNLLAQG